jgi:hypothetical protein
MERLHPGVYIEEIPSGVRPIEGVSTSTAAFIGRAEMGPLNKAVLVTSVQEFEKKYGTFISSSFLAHTVFQFFNNGGKKCYIVRVAGSGALAAEIAIKDRKTTPAKTLTVKAANEGAWGNKLDVVIANGSGDPDNEFSIQVFKDRSDLVPPLPPLLLETHDDLSMNSAANNFVEKVVAANSSYITAEVTAANTATAGAGTSLSGMLPVGNGADVLELGTANGGTETVGVAGPPATRGTSRSGDTPSTNPPADKRKFMININADGSREITLPPEVATGPDIAAAIQTAVRGLSANTPSNQPAYNGFTCVYDTSGVNPAYLLSSGTTGPTSSVVVTNSTATSISLPAGQHRFVIEVNGDGPHVVTLTGPLADPTAIQNAIAGAVQAITPKRSVNVSAFSGFQCAYQNAAGAGNPSLLLTSGTSGVNSSVRVTDAPSGNVATLLKLGRTNGGVEITGGAILRPANSMTPSEYHLGDAVVSGNVDSVALGDDGATSGNLDPIYISGLSALDVVRDVNILSIPGIGSKAVVDAGSNYCAQRMDCFFVGDTNSTDDTVPEAQTFVNSLTVKSSYGAVYYPWLRMVDPTGKSPDPIPVPPSGFVVGMYARIDSKRGVWKAPAGTEANIGGAVGLLADTTDVQQDFLNPIGINVIRSFPASGIVIWGARTLATRSDPEYRYVPVRRTAIFLEQSIYNGIQWAVFEPNDEDLWASLRLNIGAFMMLQFRSGAFQGKTPNDAFFVKCDNQTTTQADIDAGIVNILVGFAPLKPAEFVVLKLSQKAGQPAA